MKHLIATNITTSVKPTSSHAAEVNQNSVIQVIYKVHVHQDQVHSELSSKHVPELGFELWLNKKIQNLF